MGSPAGPLPALKPVSGDGWEPRFDPVPALGAAHRARSSPNSAFGRSSADDEGQDMIPKPDSHQEMREALRALCAEFPPEYHRSHDRGGDLSGRVHRRVDQGGLARRHDPGGIWRLRPRADRGDGGDGGDQPLRRQCRPLPRPDVQYGHAAQARLQGAEGFLPAEDRLRRIAPAVDGA